MIRTFNLSSIDSVQLPKTGCTGDTIKAFVYASNTSIYNCSSINGSVSIVGQNTNAPKFVFNSPGTYTIQFTIGTSSVCPADSVITIAQGPMMNMNAMPDGCFTGNDSFYFDKYFSSGVSTQSNHFYVYRNNTQINKFTSTGIPAPILLPQTGKYVVLDSSFNGCGFIVLSDTFDLLTPAIVNLPSDYDTCIQSTISLPSKAGTTIYLDGNIVSATSLFLDSVRKYSFIYIPGCGNADTININARGVKVKGHEYIYCYIGHHHLCPFKF
ncbi:MAG: hypothetical protein SGJ10_14900 [Bacteroidota bacterium]|nr:hypothetical protein [Bacteroidota bacterium]